MRVARSWGLEWLITDRVGFAVAAREEVSSRGGVDCLQPDLTLNMTARCWISLAV
jgi:hypothetical protein